jgi:hypothetical protein
MALIHVPRPPASAYNPNRKASALLRNQVEHMHIAEKRLPERYRTQIYVNAIETEGEVAEYIGRVTQAIARAHQDARDKRAKKRTKTRARPATVLKIAESGPTKEKKKEKEHGTAPATGKAREKKKTSKKK